MVARPSGGRARNPQPINGCPSPHRSLISLALWMSVDQNEREDLEVMRQQQMVKRPTHSTFVPVDRPDAVADAVLRVLAQAPAA